MRAQYSCSRYFIRIDDVLHLVEGKIFGTGHETIIFGPWQNLGPEIWGKIL
jgi:hypothetical protein